MYRTLLSYLRGYGPAPVLAWRKPAKTYTPNGNREVARRFRQIENGQLKVTA